MKALVLKEYRKFEYTDVPIPEYDSDEVLVEVKACGICGSDIHGMDGSTGRRIPPIIMGHEASGIIKKKGNKVKGWEIGDRVTFDSTIYPQNDWYTENGQYNLSDNRMVLGVSCDEYRRNGALAEFVNVPQHILYKIPDAVNFEQAAMVEPAAVALHAINLAELSKMDTVVVIGTGIIGLQLIQLLKLKDCKLVIAVDISEERLIYAQKFGADCVISSEDPDLMNTILLNSNQRGADLIFEAVGLNETLNLAINSSRKGGSVIMVGNLDSNVDLPLQKVVTRQLILKGSCAICGEYSEVLDLIAERKLIVDDLISATVPLENGQEWFEKLYNKEKGLLKVILNP